jgi:hypothetical protein
MNSYDNPIFDFIFGHTAGFCAAYDGLPMEIDTSKSDKFNAGFKQGYTDGVEFVSGPDPNDTYQAGYDEGFNHAYNDLPFQPDPTKSDAFNEGYIKGYNSGLEFCKEYFRKSSL